MENNHNLTTSEGYKKATNFLKSYGWVINPIGWLIYKAFSPEISTEKQVKTAKDLIKAGKENGVKKMKIKVSHEAGINLGSSIEGVPINAKVGNSGFVDIEVEYK